MKNNTKKTVFNIFLFLLILSVLSCGIDNYSYLEPIGQILNYPGSTPDELRNFLHFRLPNSINNDTAPLEFKGYEIYYRIYNSLDTKNSDVSAIDTYNKNYPTTVHKYLVNTKKYHRLSSSVKVNTSPLISKTNTNDDVYIRISPYTAQNSPAVLVGTIDPEASGSPLESGENLGIPLRTRDGISNTTDLSFRFTYSEVQESNPDVTFNSNTNADTWYVQFYGFTYGLDFSYQALYSATCNLGSLVIKNN